MKVVTNESGLSVEIIKRYKENENDKYLSILGGDSSNPSWDDYLADFKEEFHPHILLMRQTIKENGMVGYTGQDANGMYFKFSDGIVLGFTWRGWGDLMQAIVDKQEGYMAYYM